MSLKKKIFRLIFILIILGIIIFIIWFFYFKESINYPPELENFDKIDISGSSIKSVELPDINIDNIDIPTIDFDLD